MTGSGQNLWQPAGQQLLLQPAKIIIPADGLRECLQVLAGRRYHQLLIQLVLRRRPSSGLGQHFAFGAVRSFPKLSEGVEEMVVPRLSRQLPVAHGIGVDHSGIEARIVEGLADRGRGTAGTGAYREGLRIHAILALRTPLDERFRVNGAGQVIVQVAALGHLAQKRQQQVGILANALEVALGAGLIGIGIGNRRTVGRERCRRCNQRGDNCQACDNCGERTRTAPHTHASVVSGCRFQVSGSRSQSFANARSSNARKDS